MSIEDRILKKNIPGKYSWWEKDGDEEQENERAGVNGALSDDDDGEEISEVDRQRALQNVPEPIRNAYNANRIREKGNTGVKGVLQDYREWRNNENEQQVLEAQLRSYLINRAARGVTRAEVGATATVLAQMQQTVEDSDEDDDDDDDFLESYRAQRMQQMRAAAMVPTFGDISEITGDEYVDAVDKVDPRVFVVVHLYEPYIHLCQRMNRTLEVLARRHPTVKFLRMRADHCRQVTGTAFDAIALPTLIIYKGGKTVNTVVRVQDEVGEELGVDEVEWLLSLEGVFKGDAAGPSNGAVSLAGGAVIAEYSAREARNLTGETVNASAHFRDVYETTNASIDREARIADFAERVGDYDPLVCGTSRWKDEPDDDFDAPAEDDLLAS
mmetsp:Transcript_39730/g.124082  ORF Transcript_39730/g.124082 Transcript_39730/m.124082 type:complete len:385 (-) Transcript_39730:46-1200(-)